MGKGARDTVSKPGLPTTLPLLAVKLSCGCIQEYRVAPPRKGDEVLCITHGAVKVTRRLATNRRANLTPKK